MVTKSRYIILVVSIIVFGLFLVGGTYAFLTLNATVTNATYKQDSTCFLIDYSDSVDIDLLPISGYLFQSSTPQGGLHGSVTLKIKDSCYLNGLEAKGTVTLNVGTATNAKLIGDAHCEYADTGEYVGSVINRNGSTYSTVTISSSSTCVTNVNPKRVWKSDDTTPALKYAVYKGNILKAVSTGYVNQTGNINLYTNFDVTNTAQTYNIYIWLDGNEADNSYVNLPFSGYLHASATQVES